MQGCCRGRGPAIRGALTCSARLMVRPSVQPLFTRKLEDVDVVEGRTAHFDLLECQVAGLPYPSISWFHNGSRIDSTDDRKMMHFVYEDNECSLVVLGAAESDGGVYTCTARNLAGEVSCKAELVVHTGMAGPGDGEEQPAGFCRQVCPREDQGQAVSTPGAAHPLAAGP
uniref:Ig-like domain-containing protein n=1 Tax=Dromaius novaehollandiae TaxID=8790 RepID=A0A8C4KPS5_DRONO